MLLRTIVYDHSMEEFIEVIFEIQTLFSVKNIKIGIKETVSKNNHIIKLFSNTEDIRENKSINNSLNLYLSMELFKLLSDQYTKKKLKKVVEDNYLFFKENEINYLVKKVDETLNSDKIIIEKNGAYFINKKNEILSYIIDCIKDVNELNLNGFITFRKKYIEDKFYEITKEVMENYIVEKEYKEFVKLLRYFVNLQESTIDEINIVIKNIGEYKILNKKGEDISKKLLEDLKEKTISGIINMEDLIISSLITNVPKRIIIHGYKDNIDNDFINTIKDVFMERVAFCLGCELCKVKNKKEDNKLL